MTTTTATDPHTVAALARHLMGYYGLPANFSAEAGLIIDPRLINHMQRAVDLVLPAALATDPNGTAQGVVYSRFARLGEPITTNNSDGWLDRNRLAPEEMTTSNLAEALIVLMQAAAKELGVPELLDLLEYADHAADHDDRAKRSLMPPQAIVLPRPYIIDVFSDGDPDDFQRVENLYRAFSYTGVLINCWSISNQPAGLLVLQELAVIHGRYTDNVKVHDLGSYPGGFRGVSDVEFLRLRAAALATWYAEIMAPNRRLIAA
jgi:hypothetical protein